MRQLSAATRPTLMVAKAAAEMGLLLNYSHSRLSEAEYLTVWLEDEDGGDIDRAEIRLATHETRPGRLAADFDAAKWSGHAGTDGDIWSAIAWMAERFGRAAPGWADPARAAARSASASAAAKTRADASRQTEAEFATRLAAEWRGKKGALPRGCDLAMALGLSNAAASRVRNAASDMRKVTAFAVAFAPVGARPSGANKAEWRRKTENPWSLAALSGKMMPAVSAEGSAEFQVYERRTASGESANMAGISLLQHVFSRVFGHWSGHCA